MYKTKFKPFKFGIFGQLVVSYILFSFLLVVSLVLTFLFSFLSITNGNIDQLNPYEIVDDSGNIKDISYIEKLGGWVEKLDSNYDVIEIYGDKRDDVNNYSQSDIYKYLNTNNYYENLKYRGFIKEVNIDSKTYYFLIKVERSVLTVQYSISISSEILGNAGTLIMLLFIFLFFTNCILISLFLSKKIKKPLKSLTLGMEKVRNGQENVRINFKTSGEFKEIKDTFNLMMDKLEREKSEKEQNEKKKKRMLLDLSHDIKTPITTIKSHANALEQGLVSELDKEKYYKIIDKKSIRVSNLIDNMFTTLMLDNPDYILNKTSEDINELIREVCSEHYDEIINKQFNLNVHIPNEKYFVSIDKNLFQRVISNLIENSTKYNKTGENMWIIVKKINHDIIISIEDDGEIINDEVRENLFEPFVRGDLSRPSNEGTGLGLAISKAIVEKHNGHIEYNYINGRNTFKIIIKSL